jgi:hypothetical protein
LKILAFAHVTFCVKFGSYVALENGELLVNEMVLNHPEKHKIQRETHDFHHLLLQRRDGLAVEFCSYPETRRRTPWKVSSLLQIHGAINSQRIIRSRSFSAKFIQKLSIMTATPPNPKGKYLDLPTVNPKQTVRISSSLIAPRFKRELDALGPVALAFWVDSLDSFPPDASGVFEGLHTLTDVFPVTIGSKKIKVAFARLEGVSIEFLCR